MNLAPKALQNLTDKFLQEFFELAHAESLKEKEESTMPQLVNTKRNDSYQFNYTLAECLGNSEHVKAKQNNGDYPLIGSGFASNVVKHFFKNNIKGINKDLLYIVKNHEQQDSDLDYFIDDVETTHKDITTKDINVDSIFDKTQPFMIEVKKKETTHTFTIHNTKSGYEGSCKILLINDKIPKEKELL